MISNIFFLVSSLIAFGIFNSVLVFGAENGYEDSQNANESVLVFECDKDSCQIGELCVASVNGSFCIDSKSVMKRRHSYGLKYLSWKTGFWLLVPILSYFLAQPIIYLCGRFHSLGKWIMKFRSRMGPPNAVVYDEETQLRSYVRAKVKEMSEQ